MKTAVVNALGKDEREAKLPMWLQNRLEALRRELTTSVKEVFALKEGTVPNHLWVEDFSTQKRFYLPRYSGQLRFGNPEATDRYMLSISSWLDGGRQEEGRLLQISTDHGAIKVLPRATNVVYIGKDEP